MCVGDYFENEKHWWLRLHEKGGKRHEVPCHHSLGRYLDSWIEAASIGRDKKGWLFRSIRKGSNFTSNRMDTDDVLRMIKRRAKGAGVPYASSCHTFRATGITTYLKNGGTLEHAQQRHMSRLALPSSTTARATRYRWTRSNVSKSKALHHNRCGDIRNWPRAKISSCADK